MAAKLSQSQCVNRQIGQLSMYMNLNEMKTVEDSNRKLGVPYRKLSNQELKAEFPQFRMPNHTEAILEKQSGMIRADKALQAFQVRVSLKDVTLTSHERCDVLHHRQLDCLLNSGFSWQ